MLPTCETDTTRPRGPTAPHAVCSIPHSRVYTPPKNNHQAREFNETVGLTGLILTKLDGTARGGAVVSVVDQLGLPVKFVGLGEGADDLSTFDPQSFADALFPDAPAAK